MARVHTLLLTLASSSVLYSGLAPALGLGAITLHSALHQPLEADIQLLEVGDLSADEVRVRLASEADFLRSGVERLFFLNDLRFTPLFDGARSHIRVTSSKSIREPYLNFVVELVRPNGQLLREYTLLIDPPSTSAYRAVAQMPAYAQPQLTPQRPAKRAKPAPVALAGKRYRVLAGDSLWLIAQRLHTDASQPSVQTLMADIQGLNPQAFVAGDRSRLKLGASLLLPDSIGVVVAAKPSAPLAEPHAPSASALPLGVAPPASTTAEVAQAQQRLEQELAAYTGENRQLQASLLVLQAQLSVLQAQMQAKDQQLESLRADLALNRAQTQLAPPTLPVTGAAVANAPALTAAPAPAPSGSNTVLLAWLLGGSSLLLGLLGAMLWRARGRQSPVAALVESGPQLALEPALELAAVEAAAAFGAEPQPLIRPATQTTTRPAAATADALEGANIYIAYGRFSEALGILRKGVAAQPQRTELRLRLLEVLGELGDSAGFTQEAAILRLQGVSPARLDSLGARFAQVLVSEPEIILDDAVLALDEELLTEVAPSPQAPDEVQLNLEDLSLDADWDLLSPSKPAPKARSKAAALAPVANDPAFRSDLEQLPEVSEVQFEQQVLSPFTAWQPEVGARDELIDETFIDAFAADSSNRIDTPAVAGLEHLASNRENLLKLNKALAYIAQGNVDSACSILNEVISDGDPQQQQEARELLAKIA